MNSQGFLKIGDRMVVAVDQIALVTFDVDATASLWLKGDLDDDNCVKVRRPYVAVLASALGFDLPDTEEGEAP